MHLRIHKKSINLKESKKRYKKGFRGQKEEREVL